MKKVFIKKCVLFCVMMLTMAAYCVNITACKEAHVNHSASASAIETDNTDFTDKEFTVNGINYSINDDNKTVTVGKNKDVNGILNIPASVTYNGKTYSVTKIGKSAFSECSGLTQVIIPNSVTRIGISAFSECSGLTQVTIPNSVTKIGGFAFAGCRGLSQVTIPNSVTKIGAGAFSQCIGLTSISVASDNPNYDSRNNCNAIIKTKTNSLIAGCKSTIIPNSVTKIEKSAFQNCIGLTQVAIPNSVTEIGPCAFEGCSGLTQVNIPNSVTKIGNSAFFDCSGLTQVTVPKWLANDENEMKRVFGDFKGTVKVNSDSNE